jgi:hypothetical protein
LELAAKVVFLLISPATIWPICDEQRRYEQKSKKPAMANQKSPKICASLDSALHHRSNYLPLVELLELAGWKNDNLAKFCQRTHA